MWLVGELLATGAECPNKGGILTPEYFLFRPQVR
jgi:hypothetical protein